MIEYLFWGLVTAHFEVIWPQFYVWLLERPSFVIYIGGSVRLLVFVGLSYHAGLKFGEVESSGYQLWSFWNFGISQPWTQRFQRQTGLEIILRLTLRPQKFNISLTLIFVVFNTLHLLSGLNIQFLKLLIMALNKFLVVNIIVIIRLTTLRALSDVVLSIL